MKKLFALVLALSLALCAASALGETLIVATNPEFPPFEYMDGEEVAGLDIDIGREIAKDLGWDFEVQSMAFDSIIPAITSGKATVAITGMTITDERKLSLDFSEPYYNAKQACVVLAGGTVTDGETLKDKLIGVQLGTTGDLQAENFTSTDKVMRYSKALDAMMELAGGKLDAVIVDAPVAANLVASMNNDQLVILDNVEFADEFYGVGVKKGSDELLASINATIERINTDGTMDALLQKYFGEDAEAAEDAAETDAAEADAPAAE